MSLGLSLLLQNCGEKLDPLILELLEVLQNLRIASRQANDLAEIES